MTYENFLEMFPNVKDVISFEGWVLGVSYEPSQAKRSLMFTIPAYYVIDSEIADLTIVIYMHEEYGMGDCCVYPVIGFNDIVHTIDEKRVLKDVDDRFISMMGRLNGFEKYLTVMAKDECYITMPYTERRKSLEKAKKEAR